MIDFRKAMGNLRNWERLRATGGASPLGAAALDSALKEMHGAGSNPGNLRMFAYVPDEKAAPEYPRQRPVFPRIDVGAVITQALTAAGLMRGK